MRSNPKIARWCQSVAKRRLINVNNASGIFVSVGNGKTQAHQRNERVETRIQGGGYPLTLGRSSGFPGRACGATKMGIKNGGANIIFSKVASYSTALVNRLLCETEDDQIFIAYFFMSRSWREAKSEVESGLLGLAAGSPRRRYSAHDQRSL
jgi:hypothetical protein